MPNPAFEKLKQTVTTITLAGARAGEKAVRSAVPVVRRSADDLVSRIRKPEADRPAEAASAATEPTPPAAGAAPEAPTPASIAKNVPHQRPVAKPAPAAKKSPTDSPGGKLPPRR